MASNGSTRDIIPVRQADVTFYGETLIAVLASDDELYMSVAQMCKSLHLDVQAQTRRIRRTEALADGLRELSVTSSDGKRYLTICLRVELVPGWLAGVSTSKIEDETLRKKIVAYQRELYAVAWAVFGPEKAAVMPAARVASLTQEMGAIMRRMESIDHALSALYEMLDDQKNMNRGLAVLVDGLKAELEALRNDVGQLETRTAGAFKVTGEKLKRLELKLNPGNPITDEQAARLKAGVNHIASEMRKRGTANPYAQIWGAFNHYFNVPEYRSLPQGKFAEALDWLTRWETDLLEGKAPPTE